MKFKLIINIILISFFCCVISVKASNVCTVEAAQQLAKIVYKEVGADCAQDSSENFFMKLTTANVAINNAYSKSGNSLYEKLNNLTNNNYQGYSSYKNSSFNSVIPASKQGEMLYIAHLILTGKYTIPSNIYLQASDSIVNTYGTVWASVKTTSGFYDVYFGYTGGSLSNRDVFGNNLPSTNASYYKNLANSLKISNYSSYSSSTVCSNTESNNNQSNNNNNNNNNNQNNNSNNDNNNNRGNNNSNNVIPTTPETEKVNFTCTSDNDSILGNPKTKGSVAYYLQLILDIIKYTGIVLCIVLTSYDFFKALFSDDKDLAKPLVKKSIPRLLFVVLLFFLPIIVNTLLSLIGIYGTCGIN